MTTQSIGLEDTFALLVTDKDIWKIQEGETVLGIPVPSHFFRSFNLNIVTLDLQL